VHPCFSGYLWTPQKVVPHLHLNPVNPTRLRHVKHRFGWAATTATSSPRDTTACVRTSLATSGKVNAGGGRDTVAGGEEVEEEEEEEERAISMEDLEEE
jgi:hypothetical protein